MTALPTEVPGLWHLTYQTGKSCFPGEQTELAKS